MVIDIWMFLEEAIMKEIKVIVMMNLFDHNKNSDSKNI
jgi:hypothetical protein